MPAALLVGRLLFPVPCNMLTASTVCFVLALLISATSDALVDLAVGESWWQGMAVLGELPYLSSQLSGGFREATVQSPLGFGAL